MLTNIYINFCIGVNIPTGFKHKCFEFVQSKHSVSDKCVFNSRVYSVHYLDKAGENIHSGGAHCIRSTNANKN